MEVFTYSFLIFAAGFTLGWIGEQGLWEQKKRGKREQNHRPSLASVTRWLFVTSQAAALCWVSISYLIALYATLRLGQVFPVVELSQQAITTILGVSALKVVENIFEHNDGVVFGQSKKEPVSDLDTGPEKEDVSDSDTFSDL
jgi:hypothetical protein